MNSQSSIKIEAVCMREEVMGYCLGRQTLFQPRKSDIEPFKMFKNIFRKTIELWKKLGKIRSFQEINKKSYLLTLS